MYIKFHNWPPLQISNIPTSFSKAVQGISVDDIYIYINTIKCITGSSCVKRCNLDCKQTRKKSDPGVGEHCQ